jgi:hypothetical protein
MNVSDIITILGLLGSFVGIPVTFIAARRAPQRPELRYSIDFDVLLMPSDGLFAQGLRMTLGTQSINRISRTRVAIWNNGDEIEKTHIHPKDPLRIQFEGDDHVLQSNVIGVSRKLIGLEGVVNPDFSRSLLIDFDFLDTDDGGVIEVIHQGLEAPKILGTVRGSRIISNGSAKLDPLVLTAIARKSLSHRIWNFIGQHSGGIFVMLLCLGGSIYWAITDVINPVYLSKPGQLIEPRNYNLNTSAGQIKFVKAVENTAYYNDMSNRALSFAVANKALTLILILCLILIVVTFCGFYLTHIFATRVPVNIARYGDSQNITEEGNPNPSSPSTLCLTGKIL